MVKIKGITKFDKTLQGVQLSDAGKCWKCKSVAIKTGEFAYKSTWSVMNKTNAKHIWTSLIEEIENSINKSHS